MNFHRLILTITLLLNVWQQAQCQEAKYELFDDIISTKQLGFLYAPWRNLSISKPELKSQIERPCPFCLMIADSAENDPKNIILSRHENYIIALNLFPYSALGHLLIIPKKHVASINDLTAKERAELAELINESLLILKNSIEPDGFNYGVNEGAIAGASIPGHAHFHIVPRIARCERAFMQVIGGTEVVSWDMNKLYNYLTPFFDAHFNPKKNNAGATHDARDIKAIIFDCDGVLVDTEYLKFLSWQSVLKKLHSIDFSLEEYMTLVGQSPENIVLKIGMLKNKQLPQTLVKLWHDQYLELQAQGVPPIQEMIDFIKELTKKKEILGLKLGLASSGTKKEIMVNLNQMGLMQAFDAIVSGADDLTDYHDAEGKNKPKPYVYIETAKRLNVNPLHCLVFEDSATGVQAAWQAQMKVVAIPNKFTAQQDFAHADLIIDSILKLSHDFKINQEKIF